MEVLTFIMYKKTPTENKDQNIYFYYLYYFKTLYYYNIIACFTNKKKIENVIWKTRFRSKENKLRKLHEAMKSPVKGVI